MNRNPERNARSFTMTFYTQTIKSHCVIKPQQQKQQQQNRIPGPYAISQNSQYFRQMKNMNSVILGDSLMSH